MKRIDKFFGLIALATFAVVGCAESEVDSNLGIVPGSDAVEQSDRATLTLRSGGDIPTSKVAYEKDGLDITLAWQVGDMVTLFDDAGAYQADFLLSPTYAGSAEGVFNSTENYKMTTGDYQIWYPKMTQPAENYVVPESDQSVGGDVSHLKSCMALMGELTYSGSDVSVTLQAQQCVIALTLLNVDAENPVTRVTYECDGETSVVNLSSHDSSSLTTTIYIPANPKDAGKAATITVYYGSGSDYEKDTTTLTQDQEKSQIYYYAVNMDPDGDFGIVGDGAAAESGSLYIEIPVTGIVANIDNVSGFTVTVKNGETVLTGLGVQGVEKGLGGAVLKLELTEPIYADDVVKVEYDDATESVKSKDGKPLGSFTLEGISPTLNNLIYEDYQDVYGFEVSTNTTQTNHKAFSLSSDDCTDGVYSLHYSYQNSLVSSTMTTAKELAYYMGKTTAYNLTLTGGEEYIAVFDVLLTQEKNSEVLNIRVKTSNQALHPIDFSSAEVGKWSQIVTTIDASNSYSTQYTDGTSFETFLAFIYTNSTLVAYDDDYYIDNMRVYRKDSYLRPAQSGDIGLGELVGSGEF